MNDEQSETLDRIASDVQETKTRTRVIDERLESLKYRVENVEGRVDSHADDIDNLQSTTRRNATIISGAAAAFTAILVWVADKVMRLVP